MKKIFTVAMAFCVASAQLPLPIVVANAIEADTAETSVATEKEASKETISEESKATTETTENNEVTSVKEQPTQKEQTQSTESKEDSQSTSEVKKPSVSKRTFSENFAQFDGVSLSGENDGVSYNNYQSSIEAKTLSVSAVFEAKEVITSRTLEVKLENGLSFASLPGMKATNSAKTDWKFDASTLPVQLQGVIVKGTYVPNPTITAGYQPKAGKIVYEINSGASSVNMSVGITTDRALNVSEQKLTFQSPLKVKSTENGAVIQEEQLETFTVNGYTFPVLYASGRKQNLTLQPGEEGSITRIIAERNDKTPLISVSSLVEKLEYVFKVDKNAGIKDVTYPANPAVEKVVIDRERDAVYDYVTVTLENTYLNASAAEQSLNFVYEVPDGAIEGIYYLTVESAKVTANGQEFMDATSWTAERQIINVSTTSNIQLSDVSNKNFVYDPLVSDTNMAALGGFSLSNMGTESAEQKVRLTFDDENIGVRAVSIPHEAGKAATDVVVKTSKGQTLNADNLKGSAMYKSYNYYRYNLLLSSLGTVDKDEYITEVTYNMGKIASGSNSNSSYLGSLNMINDEANALPIAYHGYLLTLPTSKSFSASAAIVAADKDFDDEQTLTVTNTMTVVEPKYTTFANTTNITNSTQFSSGSTQTIKANLNITGYPYSSTSPSVVQGFDVYLRGGEYLNINANSIKITYENKTYSVADGDITATAGVDNAGFPLYKVELPDMLLGRAKGESFSAFSGINLSYDVKVKSAAPTTYIPGQELIQVFAKNLKTTLNNGGNIYYNNPDIYDVNGNGDTNEYAGTLSYAVGIQLTEQKNFSVTTSANLNDGPWVSYDYKTNMDIINLNPSGTAKYQLSISNNAGGTINGYTALIPIPKAGEKTDLTPATTAEFDANRHLQKTAFGWTASLLEEIVPSNKLNYEILYATSYETDKDSANFKTWNEISNKDAIRMVKVETKDAIEEGLTDSIILPLALTDPDADLHAGKTNIYSARIYRDVLGNVGYSPSEPVAIRLKTGVIKGQVFNDTNRNGLKEATETGINGITVRAYETGSNRTKLIESTLTKTIEGVEGRYELAGLDKDQKVDIVFVNPSIDDSARFSPVTAGGSTPTPDSDQRNAQTTKVTPSNPGSDAINAGLIRPVTITLDAGGGSTAQETIKKYPGEVIAVEPKAELKGKTFTGWFTQASGGEKVSFPYTASANDITLYARYINNSYQVIYDVEGKTEEVTADYDKLLTKPEDPSKAGYTFSGWYTEAVGGEKWDFATMKMPAHDVTLYARFSVGEYTLTFNHDSQTSTQSVEYNALATEPETPNKVGYTFVGWYNAQTGGEKWDFATTKMPAHDVTLYARFSLNNYTVTFINEGQASAQTVDYEALITEPAAPVKTGYTFDGWYTEISGGEKWQFTTNKMPSSNLTLYARFTINAYTLTFNNEGEINTQTLNYDALATAPTAPKKDGYTFIGWYDAPTGGQKWNFSTDKMPAHDHTLYARYDTNAYTVTYDNQGKIETEAVVFDDLLTEPKKPTKAGYRFIGWYEAVNDVIWNFKLDKVPARDFTLTAQFEAEDQTITFDTAGGDSVTDLVAPTDSLVRLDDVLIPTKTGYQFIGWFNEKDQQVSGTITMPAGGLSLKAKWTAAEQVILFNTSGGTSVASILAKTDETFNLDEQVTTRSGYTFVGWFNEADELVSGSQKVKAGGATYTAKWTAEEQTIIFDVNGGDIATQPAAIIAPTDSEIELDKIVQPTRDGYQFNGWFDENDRQVAGTIAMPPNGLNLKAKWTAKEQVIHFNTNGGTSIPSLKLKVDETYDLDQQITKRAGYAFVGWFNEADQLISGVQTVIEGDVTYTAKWQAEEQTITFDVNGGDASSQPENIVALTDSELNLDEVALPTRAGYTFLGWFTGANQVSGVITMPAGGLTLTAKWLADDQTIHFNANGGTAVADLIIKTDASYDLSKQITLRPGYQFLGWYNEADQLVSGKQTATVGGTTYTAKWQAADQTISFDVNGGDAATQPADIKAPVGSKIDIAEVKQPTRAGYLFVGWYNGKDRITDIISMPVGGLILKAQWEKAPIEAGEDHSKNKQSVPSKHTTKTNNAQAKATKNSLPSTGELATGTMSILGTGLVIAGGVLFYRKKKHKKCKETQD